MSKAKIAIYLALIFIAGAIAGGAVVKSFPQTFGTGHSHRRHGSAEDFANFLWNQMKERLKLSEEQAAKIEPVFRAGFQEVRSIQDRSLQEVAEVVRKNHEEIGELLTADQKVELQKMNQEREEFFRKRGGKPSHRSAPSAPPTRAD